MKKVLLIALCTIAISCNFNQQCCVEDVRTATLKAAKAYNTCVELFSVMEETEISPAYVFKLADW